MFFVASESQGPGRLSPSESLRVLAGFKSAIEIGIPGIPGTMALFTTVHGRLLDAAMLIPVIKYVIRHVIRVIKHMKHIELNNIKQY